MRKVLWTFPLVLGLGWVASATAIYNNLNSGTAYFDGVCGFPGTSASCFGPLADSFSTTGSVTLTGVGVLLKGASDGGQVTVELLGDQGGRPGTDLVEVGVIKDTELSSTYQSFFFSASYRLAGSTRYWIELFDSSVAGESSADWAVCLASCQAALGVPGEFFANEGDEPGGWRVFPNSFGPYQMEVEARPNPEPRSWLLLVGGLGIMAGWLRKQND